MKPKLFVGYIILSLWVISTPVLAQNETAVTLLRKTYWYKFNGHKMDTLIHAKYFGCISRRFYVIPPSSEIKYIGFMGGNIQPYLTTHGASPKELNTYRVAKIAAITFYTVGAGLLIGGFYQASTIQNDVERKQIRNTYLGLSVASIALGGISAYLSEWGLVKSTNKYNSKAHIGLNYIPNQQIGLNLNYNIR